MNSEARTQTNSQQTIIFDLDGTLYRFKEGSFRKSGLQQKVLENARLYVVEKCGTSKDQAEKIINNIINRYGENISVGLEKEFGLDRYNYFDQVWNIPAREFICEDKALQSELKELSRDFHFLLLSDAPRIWIDHVLSELNIRQYFIDKVYSGEGDARKVFGNAFEAVVDKFGLNPALTWSVGDQEETDILPAKQAGLNTVLIGEGLTVANYSISSIMDLRHLFKSQAVID
jgi:FMN phosphatase YigB (HAD superfamily)